MVLWEFLLRTELLDTLHFDGENRELENCDVQNCEGETLENFVLGNYEQMFEAEAMSLVALGVMEFLRVETLSSDKEFLTEDNLCEMVEAGYW